MGSDLAIVEAEVEYPAGNGSLMQVASGSLGLTPYVDEAKHMMKAIRDLQRDVLREGIDYGPIPGTGNNAKFTLFKSGAESLLAAFRLTAGDPVIQTREIPHPVQGHVEYVVTIPIINRANNQVVGSGVGSCTTMETKYRYRNGERACPNCGKATIRKSKEDNGGWYCWRKIDGCGATFQERDTAITNQVVGKVENPDPSDLHNTVLKMAKKRALVDGALTTTAASGVFTQDVEDNAEDFDDHPQSQARQGNSAPKQQQAQPKSASQPAQQTQQRPAQQNAPASSTQANTPAAQPKADKPKPALPLGQQITVNVPKTAGTGQLADGGPVLCWAVPLEDGTKAYIWCSNIAAAQKATGKENPADYTGELQVKLQQMDLQIIDSKTKQPKTQPACLVTTFIAGAATE